MFWREYNLPQLVSKVNLRLSDSNTSLFLYIPENSLNLSFTAEIYSRYNPNLTRPRHLSSPIQRSI